jgi:DNA mismatch repair protein MutL
MTVKMWRREKDRSRTMPGKIQILPEDIAQKIAAGEVIERPASVVKELLENSIDAGASDISVELRSGGLQLIRISDNGEGISPEDVPLAFQRYATSKMKKAEDLFAIHTLGFRGEALPSIAAVSQMTMKTRTSHSMTGTKAVCEGGEIKRISEVGCPIGTEVEVRNLFFNIPVKRKFLKSIQTELRNSISHFLRLSLAHPSISFKFFHDDRTLHEHLKTESAFVRMEAVLGRDIYHHLQPIAFEDGEIRITGFASLPSFSKGNGDGIYLYVNRRFIKDRMIYRAVVEAYRHVIPAGRFPVVILFVHTPPSSIDVNVHPTKTEVKFKDSDRVFRTVHGALASLHALPSLQDPRALEHERISGTFAKRASSPIHSFPVQFSLTEEGEKPLSMVKEATSPEWNSEKKSDLRILGQVQGTYILCEGEKGLIFIDQHAAHERILFEKYKREYEEGSVVSERLLLPMVMEFSTEESFILMSYLEIFQSMGFEIDPVGERTYAIRSIPSWIHQRDPQEIIRAILDELSFIQKEGKGPEPLHTMFVTLACHSAIRANFVLRREEMSELVGSLSSFKPSITCPHGRPVLFAISLEELAKQFKRKP